MPLQRISPRRWGKTSLVNKVSEQMNGLTQYQIRFVRAVMDGKAQEVNRKEVIDEYELGSSANELIIYESNFFT